MSSSRVSGMKSSCALAEFNEQLAGKLPEERRVLALSRGGRVAGVRGAADVELERDAAKEGDVHHLRRGLGAAAAERIADLAAMRAGIAGHILDQDRKSTRLNSSHS